MQGVLHSCMHRCTLEPMHHESTISQPDTHQLNARISHELNDRLDLVAFKMRRAKAEIVREALEYTVTRLEQKLQITGENRHGKTA